MDAGGAAEGGSSPLPVAEAKSDLSTPGTPRGRILVVEDDAFFRVTLCRVLQHHRYAVEWAEDGLAAVQMYRSGGYDLVLLDMIMPQQDGVETLFALQQLDPCVRLVAMSGGGYRIDGGLCLDWAKFLGVRWLLRKPFTQEELLAAIARALQGVS